MTTSAMQGHQGSAGLEAALDEAIDQLGELPVLDRTVQRVRTLADDPGASTADLVATLEADPNLALNVLRYANSAACARPVRAATLHQAVTLIGRRAIGRMAMEAAVCRFFEQAPGSGGAARGQLHVHAVQVAACAAELARRTGADPTEAHLAGLLHDLGKLVLPVAFGEGRLDAVLTAGGQGGPLRVAAEREGLGLDHAQAGARFARRAGLDEDLCAAIAAHHGSGDGPPAPLAATVQAANAAVALLHGHPADGALLADALAALGLDAGGLEDIALAALPSLNRPPEAYGLAFDVARLEREARTDELTGLLNRRYWSLAAREALAAHGGTVLICDVDHFKRVNDFHGHHTGDFVLGEVGRVLDRHGIAGRLGGDEFALLVGPAEDGAAIAEELELEVVRRFGEGTLQVSISSGVARASGPGEDLSALLRAADEALYAAKAAGRETYRHAA